MGHLQATAKRIESDEAHAAYDGWTPGDLPTDSGAPSGEQWTPDEIARFDADDGIGPGPIIREHVDLGQAPLPRVGHMVLFHLRAGDARNRRSAFPSIVMAVDEERGELELQVMVDANDTWMQERVRERAAPEAGWERIAPDALVEFPAKIFEDALRAIEDLRGRIDVMDRAMQVRLTSKDMLARLEAIENHPALEVPPLQAVAAERLQGLPKTSGEPRRKRRG